MAGVNIAPGKTEKVKLSPMPLIPAMSFNFQNSLDTPVVISVSGKNVKIEKAKA